MSGGGDPAAQSLATQTRQFHPGRSPKPGSTATMLSPAWSSVSKRTASQLVLELEYVDTDQFLMAL